jgi:multidrug resistance efflux pump
LEKRVGKGGQVIAQDEILKMRNEPPFLQKHALKIGLSLPVAVALVLSIAHPVSQAISGRAHTSSAIVLPAIIRPHHVVTISSGFPGSINAVNVSAGQEVKAQDVLITLVDPEFGMEYERAKVHLESIRRRLAHRSISDHSSDLPRAEAAFSAASERLKAFHPEVSQSYFEKTQAHFREVEKLAQQGLATDVEVEQARHSSGMALQEVQNEREHLSRLKEEAENAASRVADSRRFLVPTPTEEELDLRRELLDAEAAVELAGRRLGSQKVLATGPGTVLKVLVNVGDQIPSGVPLLQMGRLDLLDLDVPVDALLAKRIRVGQMVKVRLPTEPSAQLLASVSSISPVPSQDQSAYTVRITAKNPAPSEILVGLSGQVEFAP